MDERSCLESKKSRFYSWLQLLHEAIYFYEKLKRGSFILLRSLKGMRTIIKMIRERKGERKREERGRERKREVVKE